MKQVLHLKTEAKKGKKTDSAEQESTASLECEFCRYPAKDLLDLGKHVYIAMAQKKKLKIIL